MSSNKSIGIWCTPVRATDPIKIEVHFNYWRIQPHTTWLSRFCSWLKRSSDGDFVEVGIMVDDIRRAEKIHIFFPAVLSASQICDCSPYFIERDIVQGIFNEQLKAANEPDANGPLVLRHANNNRIYGRMHNFATRPNSTDILMRHLKLRRVSGGTICTIESEAIKACSPRNNHRGKAYFRLRFRVPMRKRENPFVEDVPVFDRFLLSGYEHVEYLDFRLNDARTLPTPVEQQMANDQPENSTVISLVAFLTAVPVSAALSVTHTAFHKMRLLENEIWTKYADGIPNGMVVYHWRKDGTPKKPIDDFSAFVKLQIRLSSWQILLKYLIFALVFGVFGNLVAGWLQPNIGSFFGAVGEFLSDWLGILKNFELASIPG
jgi:hypothetical protein